MITTSRVEPADGATPYFMAILQDITAQRTAEREAGESRTRLARYAGTLTTAIEAERSRIARELHDALGQALTSLKMDLGWIGRRLPRDIDETTGAPVTARIAGMQAFIDDTVVLVRRLASELRPAILDSLGLSAALRAHAGEFTDHTDTASRWRPAPTSRGTLVRRACRSGCTRRVTRPSSKCVTTASGSTSTTRRDAASDCSGSRSAPRWPAVGPSSNRVPARGPA